MYETSLLILPPFLPCSPLFRMCVTQFLGVRHISDGSVKPNIEHLSLGTLNRDRDSPFEVACHGTWLQVHVKPALALSIYIGAPFLVSLKNPLLKPFLIFTERQIPILSWLFQESMTRIVLVGWIDEFFRRQCGAAFLTLVAVCTLGTASWTSAHDVAVGEEFSRHFIAELFLHVLLQFSLVV